MNRGHSTVELYNCCKIIILSPWVDKTNAHNNNVHNIIYIYNILYYNLND